MSSLEPVHLIRKHSNEHFTDVSSNDEGFGSEAPTSMSYEKRNWYSSVCPTMIEEKEEDEQHTENEEGHLDQEEWESEEDVEDPNYILYEEERDIAEDYELIGNERVEEEMYQKVSRFDK